MTGKKFFEVIFLEKMRKKICAQFLDRKLERHFSGQFFERVRDFFLDKFSNKNDKKKIF